MAFEGLLREAAQILAATAGPDFSGEGCHRFAKYALGKLPGICGEQRARALPVPRAKEAVGQGVKAGLAGEEALTACGAAGEVGEPAHEARHPQGEIGQRHPGLLYGGVIKDGEHEAEDGFLGIVLLENFIENLGVKAENGDAGVVDGGGQGGAEEFELVEANELLAWAFDEEGACEGHGLERATKTLATLERRFGDAFDFAVVPGKEADDEVGFIHGPGTEDQGV